MGFPPTLRRAAPAKACFARRMDPLDLTHTPPRSPRATLRGLCMLPRMIDIARALLPGGRVGEYQVGRGLSGMVFYKLGLGAPEFGEIVAAAPDEEAVADQVLRGLDEPARARLNARLEGITVADIPPDLRPAFERYYGGNVPADRTVFDHLDADDAGKLGSGAGAS